jgi:hypothetical protein
MINHDQLEGDYCRAIAEDHQGNYTTENLMFSVTHNGLYLLARPHVREGDVIAVLDGGKVPMVLRKVEQKSCDGRTESEYKLVCPAYVHGFMDGEAEVGVAEGWLKKQDILLV